MDARRNTGRAKEGLTVRRYRLAGGMFLVFLVTGLTLPAGAVEKQKPVAARRTGLDRPKKKRPQKRRQM